MVRISTSVLFLGTSCAIRKPTNDNVVFLVKKEVFQFYKKHDKIRMHAVKERCANKISDTLLLLIYERI